jgi:ankyrin repeat protein
LHGNNALIRAQLQGLSHEEKALYLSYPSKHEQVNALHIAASNNWAVCLETMLQSVDGEGKERILSAQDPQGYTALHWAVANKALESIATLTKYMSPSCQALRNHAGKTAVDMTTDPHTLQWLSNHHDSSISESPQALPTTRPSSRDTMDKLKAMHDSFEDYSKDRAPYVDETKNPKDDEEGPKQAKGSFK